MEVADKTAQGRVVSVLEGGYDLEGLSRSVAPPALIASDARRVDRQSAPVQRSSDQPAARARELRIALRTFSQASWPTPATADVKKMTFERAIEELESIVKRLEEGKVPLEESVAIYERGEALKKRCEELLRQAEARVEKITLDASGKPTGSEPLDVD